MTYYDVMEVFLDENGNIQEKKIACKDSHQKATDFLELAKALKPDSKIYVSEDDSLDH